MLTNEFLSIESRILLIYKKNLCTWPTCVEETEEEETLFDNGMVTVGAV